jgi:hypothetical protein
MNAIAPAAPRLNYGRRLVHAGISGIRNGQDDLPLHSVSHVMADALPDSLKLAAIGACLSLLPACFSRRPRPLKAVALGVLGSALGFCVGFTWKTRGATSTLTRSALREVRKVNDEHWLEKHPIDYA